MSQQQFYAEVMAELELMENNTKLGIGESSVTTFVYGRGNCSTDGKIWQVGSPAMYQREIKRH